MSPQPLAPTQEFVTPLELAQYLRISTETLKDWRQQKRGPAYFKLGRRVMYRRRDVEAFIEAELDAAAAS